jgi:hypothetical protein
MGAFDFPCSIAGNSDMYGPGIRISFYLQWTSYILAPWIAPSEVPSLRLATSLSIFVTFVALVLQVMKDSLHAVEIHIVLLFIFGSNLIIAPALLWSFITRFDFRCDPFRVTRTKPGGPLFVHLYSILLAACCLFQLWFWTSDHGIIPDRFQPERRYPRRASTGLYNSMCANSRYGFLFGKVKLGSPWLRGYNIATNLVLLLSIIALECIGTSKRGRALASKYETTTLSNNS